MKKNFSRIPPKILKNITSVAGVILLLAFFYVCFQIYFPENFSSNKTIVYAVKKGYDDKKIAGDLQKLGIIKSVSFFEFYDLISLQHSSLKAGDYNLSPRMSIYQIVKKISNGDIIKNNLVILEGWTVDDIGKYMQSKGVCSQTEFASLAKQDYSDRFDFLADKPKNVSLEGYLFPDTYQVSDQETCDDAINLMLENFGKKLTPALRTEIKKQKKSIFDIVTMASMIEKEVRSFSDKKIVSGILWKRIAIGMPLQLDSTINYITDGNDPSVSIKNTKIKSPYNTYMYPGLPKGPISNPGIDSITAAIYPTKTNYLYWLSDGVTRFSETLEEHNANRALYLGR